MWDWRAPCGLFRSRALFTRAGSPQEVDYIVIVLVTGVLVHLLVGVDLGPRNDGGPGPGPCFRILDREFVVKRSSVDAGKALRDAESIGIGPLEDHAIVGPKIGGL